MKPIELRVEARSETGKVGCARLRASGIVPAVVYGAGSPISLSLNAHDFLNTSSYNGGQIYVLRSDSKEIDGCRALIKERQMDYLSGRLLHVDFNRIDGDRPVVVTVPLVLMGEVPSVRQGLALMQQLEYNISVKCIADNIPESVPVDVTALQPGESLRIAQVCLPEGVKLNGSDNKTVMSVLSKSKSAVQKAA